MYFNQSTFLGGLAAQFDRTKTEQSQYTLLLNGRVRDNVVEPIAKPLQDEGLAAGTCQGLTAVGSILIAFVDGLAYYRDVETANAWRQVLGFAMDDAATIDAESIPASTVNFKRDGAIDAVKFNNSSARASLEGVLVCDGVTQPHIIYPTIAGTIEARATYTYAQWTESAAGTEREYVPIGRFPRFVGRKLYMAIESTTEYLNRIAQSVSGRPLDFVVKIDNATGDKAGDALSMAHSIGFDELAGLFAIQGAEHFIATTGRNTVLVVPDYSRTLFAEPTFINQPLFPVGIINNRSFVDINGDAAFITQTGIVSFNSTEQTQTASNSSPFSAQIFKLLAAVQTFGAAVDYDNYALFAVQTTFGPGVVVYDKLLSAFVALDLYAGIGQITQFAVTTATTGDRLFFITADNRLFEWGAGDTRELCSLFVGDWNGGSAKAAQQFDSACAVFTGVAEEATVQITEYADGEIRGRAAFPLNPPTTPTAATKPPPDRVITGPNVVQVHYVSTEKSLSFSSGALFEWASPARLAFCAIEVTDQPARTTQFYTAAAQTVDAVQRFAFVGDFTPAGAEFLKRLPDDYIVVGLGDFFYGADPADDYAEYVDTIGRLVTQGRWVGVAGNHDLDHDNGLIVFNRLCNGKRYDNYRFGAVEIFTYHAGWDTATMGDQPPPFEPDGNVLGSRQANWLKAALAASTARFKIVCTHFPPYTAGNYSPGYTALQLPFRAWGANLVVSAHDHNYQRHIVDGLNYIVAGTGGRPMYTTIGAAEASRAAWGWLRVETDAFKLNTEHVGRDGSRFDRFLIHP